PDDTVKEIRVPVKVGYEVMGMAVAGFSTQGIDAVIEDTMRGLRNHILLVSALVMAGGIWGSLWLARVLTTPMNRLKDGMEQVQQGNLDVEVPNEYLADCREMLGCFRDDCPAFGRKRCWTVPDTLCFGSAQGGAAGKIAMCRDCAVYRESCGDEIGELIEGFNEMTGRLKKSMEELEETNREKTRLEKLSALGQMSMTVAHEIKNPLNAIRGAVSYLQNNFQGEVLREFLSIIEDETKRLNEIVTSYLRFSKPSPLNLRVADLNDTIGETVELIRQEATENNVEVVTALDDRIPPFSFDPNQFKQALLNILVNALDATKEGDTIRVATEFVDSRAQISVKDTGTGISEEVTSEIFKPFFTTKTRGSGLGLACVERIIRDHRGDVTVTSEAGKGTEFRISLPVDDSRQT
ncbi:MAG TPA: ATP-binding protein, partial [Dissulfurispiraceae bacterium]|nr:ATP-binding protein [Dissulfurispiraceae bacterium]